VNLLSSKAKNPEWYVSRFELRARLRQRAPDDVATSIVSFHEQAQVWLAYLNRTRKPEQIVDAYA
jgi:hypothetical protein